MSEAEGQAGDWIRNWIEQQREQLRQMSGGAGDPEPAADQMQSLAARWLGVGQAYLSGLTQFAQSTPTTTSAEAGGNPSPQFSEEMLGAWRRAWAGASSTAEQAGAQLADWLGRAPPLGMVREQAEAWREFAAAQRECQSLEQALRIELIRVQNEALGLLEKRVQERRGSNQPIEAWRELYDLWVECGEQVWSQAAHSDAYCKLQAELGNAAVRLRARQQVILEHVLRQFDLPTRSEMNTVHRQVRDLRAKVAALEAQLADPPTLAGKAP